jgi:predicted DNA-binding protein (UPF0251 family)
MPRPPIERAVGGVPRVTLFKPAGVPGRDLEQLPLLSHEQAAAAMGVSRQTVGRVLERGRAKVAEALVGGKAILIGGGQYRVEPRQLCCAACGAIWAAVPDADLPAECPTCGSADLGTCWDPAGRCGRGHGSQGGGGRGCGAGGAESAGPGCQGRGNRGGRGRP